MSRIVKQQKLASMVQRLRDMKHTFWCTGATKLHSIQPSASYGLSGILIRRRIRILFTGFIIFNYLHNGPQRLQQSTISNVQEEYSLFYRKTSRDKLDKNKEATDA